MAVGRRNWLHLGGDGGLRPTAVLLSVAASAKRHGVDPWGHLSHILTELPGRPAGADLTDLLMRFIDEHIPASSLDTLRRRRSNGD